MAERAAKVDKNSPVPVYFQIEMDLKQRIILQEWSIGQQLPGEMELAQQYDVSRITLRQALAELEKDGIIRKERGRGSFLAANPVPYINSLNYAVVSKGHLLQPSQEPEVRADILEQRLVTDLFPSVCEHLGLRPEDEAVYIKRLYHIDGRPIAVSRSHLPVRLVPGMEGVQLIHNSVLETLEQVYHLQVDRVEDDIEAVRATPADRALLRCMQDTPLVLLHGTAYQKDGTALEYSNTLWSGDSVRFHLTLQNGPTGFVVQE